MRLIDADELKKCAYLESGVSECADMVVSVRDIDDAPTIDAVEVVRCKDCRHRGEPICPMDDFIASEELQDDWFCNSGIRREPEGRTDESI